MKLQLSSLLLVGVSCWVLGSCTPEGEPISKTPCHQATAIATQTWEVDYSLNKTSGGNNSQRTQSFESNTLTNINGDSPAGAKYGPDNDGVWWAGLPTKPTPDEVDANRKTGEQNDPPQLQKSVKYQLTCDVGELLTDAQTYREASRSFRAKQDVVVTYTLNRVLKILPLQGGSAPTPQNGSETNPQASPT
ncbi:MAG: hypothetical protein KME16_18520 [Scytolyngbya sp. HA4215-MV1]|jgi:hypothetical protein|nr:hypothetical protein [Scytolyngbya sp. HA4215-MV1]